VADRSEPLLHSRPDARLGPCTDLLRERDNFGRASYGNGDGHEAVTGCCDQRPRTVQVVWLGGGTLRVDHDVWRAEVVALFGPNGAGKTTTVEILEGYRSRDEGEVAVPGVDPAHCVARPDRDRAADLPGRAGADRRESVEPFAGYAESPLAVQWRYIDDDSQVLPPSRVTTWIEASSPWDRAECVHRPILGLHYPEGKRRLPFGREVCSNGCASSHSDPAFENPETIRAKPLEWQPARADLDLENHRSGRRRRCATPDECAIAARKRNEGKAERSECRLRPVALQVGSAEVQA
jgi:hypothetical protein